MKQLLPILALSLLAACQTRQSLPKVAYIPTPVACKPVQVPPAERPIDRLKGGEDIYVKTQTVLADRRVREAENERLRAANKGCTVDEQTDPAPARPVSKNR
jgi:hypothetical protein